VEKHEACQFDEIDYFFNEINAERPCPSRTGDDGSVK
jgi:hypothetical protein